MQTKQPISRQIAINTLAAMHRRFSLPGPVQPHSQPIAEFQASADKSLDTLRQTIQSAITRDIDQVIRKYLEKFFVPAVNNIRTNLGSDSVNEEQVKAVCRAMLDDTRLLYAPEKSTLTGGSDGGSGVDSTFCSKQELPTSLNKRKEADSEEDNTIKRKKTKEETPDDMTPSPTYSPAFRDPDKWDPARLTSDTMFIMGSHAHKVLGLGNARGRLYTRHAGLMRYPADTADKEWIAGHNLINAVGGKTYIMVLEDIDELAKSETYKRTSLPMLGELTGFKAPPFMLRKIKAYITKTNLIETANGSPQPSTSKAQVVEPHQLDNIKIEQDFDTDNFNASQYNIGTSDNTKDFSDVPTDTDIKDEDIDDIKVDGIKVEDLDEIKVEDLDDIKVEDLDEIKVEDLDEIKVEDLDDIKVEDLDDIKVEDLDEIKDEDLDEIKVEDLDEIKVEDLDEIKVEDLDEMEVDDLVDGVDVKIESLENIHGIKVDEHDDFTLCKQSDGIQNLERLLDADINLFSRNLENIERDANPDTPTLVGDEFDLGHTLNTNNFTNQETKCITVQSTIGGRVHSVPVATIAGITVHYKLRPSVQQNVQRSVHLPQSTITIPKIPSSTSQIIRGIPVNAKTGSFSTVISQGTANTITGFGARTTNATIIGTPQYVNVTSKSFPTGNILHNAIVSRNVTNRNAMPLNLPTIKPSAPKISTTSDYDGISTTKDMIDNACNSSVMLKKVLTLGSTGTKSFMMQNTQKVLSKGFSTGSVPPPNVTIVSSGSNVSVLNRGHANLVNTSGTLRATKSTLSALHSSGDIKPKKKK